MPHMETVGAQMDTSLHILYCFHTTCGVEDEFSGTLVADLVVLSLQCIWSVLQTLCC